MLHEGEDNAEIGDIALYNCVYNDSPLDHIGITTEVSSDSILSAEGNVDNRTGLFRRSYDCIAGFVRLPEDAEQWVALDRRLRTGK